MNILLDPYILAIPDSGSDAKIDDYLENLYLWTTAITKQGEHRYWLSEKIYYELLDSELYPFPDRIPSPRDQVYNVENVMRACQYNLFNPPPSFLDDLLENAVYYFEEDRVIVIPDAVANRLPDNVALALRETLALAALGCQLDAHPVFADLAFATVPDGFAEKMLTAQLSAQHLDADEPQEIAEEWEMLFSPDELDDLAGIETFWDDVERAIAWARKRLQAQGIAVENMAVWTEGHSFVASIRQTHMNRYPNVLRSLYTQTVKMLYGVIPRFKKSRYNNKSTPNHPIKKGGEIVTRQDDGAKAYRLVIQGEWRLHYWLLEDGSIELANVECGHAMHIES